MIRSNISVLTVLSSFFCLAWCLSTEIKESWYSHSQSVHNFKCQNPQARSFELPELFQQDDPLVLNIENVYPTMTVLHRCENAGCCPGLKYCAANETEVVNLIFGIVQPGISKIQYVHKDVSNHTSCFCKMKMIS